MVGSSRTIYETETFFFSAGRPLLALNNETLPRPVEKGPGILGCSPITVLYYAEGNIERNVLENENKKQYDRGQVL